MYVHTHTHTHIHIYAHTHTYTQEQNGASDEQDEGGEKAHDNKEEGEEEVEALMFQKKKTWGLGGAAVL